MCPKVVALALQGVYKEELQQHFGIVFNNLFCLNNMPIKRYVDYLQRRNKLEEYMQVTQSCSDCIHACLYWVHCQLTKHFVHLLPGVKFGLGCNVQADELVAKEFQILVFLSGVSAFR